MNKYLVITIIVLLAIIGAGWQQIQHANRMWEIAEANVKAYSEELSTSKNKNVALQLTVDQLSYFNDSVLQALDETRKELKIKDKNLKALQAIISGFTSVANNDTYIEGMMRLSDDKLIPQYKKPKLVTPVCNIIYLIM